MCLKQFSVLIMACVLIFCHTFQSAMRFWRGCSPMIRTKERNGLIEKTVMSISQVNVNWDKSSFYFPVVPIFESRLMASLPIGLRLCCVRSFPSVTTVNDFCFSVYSASSWSNFSEQKWLSDDISCQSTWWCVETRAVEPLLKFQAPAPSI